MKKLFILIISLFLTSNVHAGLIAISTLSSDNDVDFNYFNTSFNTIKNEFNGNIESANIKDATITISDMASTASPGQREGDHFNPYTKTGMIPATSTDLTSDISLGTSYVESDTGILYRVVTAATSKTYTASKDTWVYIDINGAFQYSEVANGAAQPTTPANSLLLAKVVTDTDNITSVTDSRTTSISLGAKDDMYLKGFQMNWVATDKLSMDTGVVYVGTTRVVKTTYTQIDTDVAGDFLDGSKSASEFLYVYIDDTGDVNFSETSPAYHDTDGITVGPKFYHKSGTEYYRYLGAVRLNASSNIVAFHQDGDKFIYDDNNDAYFLALDNGTATTFAAITLTTWLPPVTNYAYFTGMGNGGAINSYFKGHGFPAVTGQFQSFPSGGGNYFQLPTSSGQQIDYKVDSGNIDLWVIGYDMNVR